jgi:hypothetical protein
MPPDVLDADRPASSRPTRRGPRGLPRSCTRRPPGTSRTAPGQRRRPPGARGRRPGTSSWSSRGTWHGCATGPHGRPPPRRATRGRRRSMRRPLGGPQPPPERRPARRGDLRRARRCPPEPRSRSAGRQGVGRTPEPCRTSRDGSGRASRRECALAVLAGGGPPVPPEGPDHSHPSS